jgi:serine/threonine protein kinase
MTAPTQLGRYRIVKQIGRSMTDVYLAIDTVENRKAALKLVRAGSDAHSRLVMEAERRGAAIQRELWGLDPRVVEVYETGDLDGYFFVAMQYVEGRDLGAVLTEEHTIDSIRAAAIALEICEQLTKFHTWRSAVVHGDIKPSNIHLGLNDTVRLLDFGIAKTLRADCDATVAHFGSPSYCSPERLARSEIDEQSDLWAVGATLYQMLSGSPPYQAENTRKLESLIRSKRPPRALPASCPPGLRAIAMKSLAPEAARRYRSARDFQADLQAFLENKPVRAQMEKRHGWNANATMQRIRRVTHTVLRFHRHIQVVGGVSWFLLGMALWIGATMTWRAWHEPYLTLQLPAIVGPPVLVVPERVELPPDPPPAKVVHTPPPRRKSKPRRYRLWWR